MRLFSYVLARDYGFAPNPFCGWCTLATCKPKIRSSADVGDWVIGTGAKTKYDLAGRLIYAMQVAEVLDFDGYWSDPRFACKQPVLNGSLKQVYGDNIYHKRGNRWVQEDSHHSYERGRPNRRNIARDTSVDRVLIASRFVYFGNNAPVIPNNFRSSKGIGENVCCPGQGHRVFSAELTAAVQRWLERRAKWGLQGIPLEFKKHDRIAPKTSGATAPLRRTKGLSRAGPQRRGKR
jgi:hypothetical protein